MTFRPSQQRFGVRGLTTALSLLALGTSVHALQTVTPTKADGTTVLTGNVSVPAGSTFTFLGMYTDDSSGVSESGLGLKVKYNGLHLTNVSVTEEYTKCRIAAAQYPASNVPATAPSVADQVVMGWVDTSIRTLPTAGAVGWPDLADAVGTGVTAACLNPGSTPINTDFAAGTSVAPGQKLFKFTATMAASCTSPGACSSAVTLDSDNNFSYANAGAGYTIKSFTVVGAAAPSCNLDVDGGGSLQALVDGVLIVRGMLGLSGTSLNAGITFSSGATRTDPTVIANFLATQNYDVDGSASQQALVDGVIVVRLMLGLPDANLLTGITLPGSATFTTAAAIRANVNSRCGTSF